jgi:hypothetical protein
VTGERAISTLAGKIMIFQRPYARKSRHSGRPLADCSCSPSLVAIIVGRKQTSCSLFHFSTPRNILRLPAPRHHAAKLVDGQIVPAIGELGHYRECRQRRPISCLAAALYGRTSASSRSFRAYTSLVSTRLSFHSRLKYWRFVVLPSAVRNTADLRTEKKLWFECCLKF